MILLRKKDLEGRRAGRGQSDRQEGRLFCPNIIARNFERTTRQSGNLIVRGCFFIACLLALLPSCPPANAQFPIPEATLRSAGLDPSAFEIKKVPESAIVRVGIGDEAFKNYTHSNISIFGTKEIIVYRGGCAEKFPANTPVKFSAKDLAATVKIDCPDGLLGVEGLKRAGKQALYRGSFEILPVSDCKFNLINVLEVEEYLKGVVPNEMPVSFGLEALKAQSVAARNYVLSPRAKSSVNYDVVDSVASQVYFGANTERPLATEAIAQTEGIVALYGWDLILAQYSSTAGGYTESHSNAFSDPVSGKFPSAGRPYLIGKPDIINQPPLNTEEAAAAYYKSKPDSYDMRSPYFRWEREWSAQELENVLKIKDLKEIRVKCRGESGKIITLEIIGGTEKRTVSKELVIRRLITKNGAALPSANVVFEHEYDDNGKLLKIKAFGGGFGHGVGLSQYGAGFMGSELKMSYEKILKHYYTGITLGTAPVIISANPAQQEITQNFFVTGNYAKIIADNKFGASKFIAGINGRECVFALHPKLLGEKIEAIDISNYIKPGRNTITFRWAPDESAKKALRLYVETDSEKAWKP